MLSDGMGPPSQTGRKVGRHLRYIGVTVWSLGVKHTKCGVVLAAGMEEVQAASKNVDHRDQWCFQWSSGSKGSPKRLYDFHFSASPRQPQDGQN
jgi:hypothetical protein